jgi:hypothetical protein
VSDTVHGIGSAKREAARVLVSRVREALHSSPLMGELRLGSRVLRELG